MFYYLNSNKLNQAWEKRQQNDTYYKSSTGQNDSSTWISEVF